jgi:hypothetical protein
MPPTDGWVPRCNYLSCAPCAASCGSTGSAYPDEITAPAHHSPSCGPELSGGPPQPPRPRMAGWLLPPLGRIDQGWRWGINPMTGYKTCERVPSFRPSAVSRDLAAAPQINWPEVAAGGNRPRRCSVLGEGSSGIRRRLGSPPCPFSKPLMHPGSRTPIPGEREREERRRPGISLTPPPWGGLLGCWLWVIGNHLGHFLGHTEEVRVVARPARWVKPRQFLAVICKSPWIRFSSWVASLLPSPALVSSPSFWLHWW